MKIKTLLSLFIPAFILSFPLKAQDTILMMSGKIIEGKLVEVSEGMVTYESAKRGETDQVEAYRVFSILQNGNELILYQPDTLTPGYFTREQMFYFVRGEMDAHQGFRAPLTTLSGFVVGAAGGALATQSAFFLFTPLAYSGLFILPSIRIDRYTVSNEEYLLHESYVMGYERVARNKKIQNALKGSIGGMVVGIVAGFIFLQ